MTPRTVSPPSDTAAQQARELDETIRVNQQKLSSNLKQQYDFIVCGAGSSGSVVAARLAGNREVSVLLLEAGGTDEVPSIMDPAQWLSNLGSERDWAFASGPEAHLNHRSIPLAMGKVLGGGSSINVGVWACGHKADWDYYAAETNDSAWNHDSILKIYKRIENLQGTVNASPRGIGGPVSLEQNQTPHPLTVAQLEAARSIGIPVFDRPNGEMMEGAGGASRFECLVKDGKRQSIFRSYTYPIMGQPNLTVLTGTLVTRLVIEGSKVTGVELLRKGRRLRIEAGKEVVLCLGAMQTPKLLMQSGIGDHAHLSNFGIPIAQHLPGVGQNLQDHVNFGCIWEYKQPIPLQGCGAEVTFYWKSETSMEVPNLLLTDAQFTAPSPQTSELGVPEHGWTMFSGISQPHSRGSVSLSGPNPNDPLHIVTNGLSEPADVEAGLASVALAREIGNAPALASLNRREVMPGKLRGPDLLNFLRNAAVTFWHETCTAKMGRDAMSVVDSELRVHGIQNLRIADGSVFPRIPRSNTMAPCVVVGERASELLQKAHSA